MQRQERLCGRNNLIYEFEQILIGVNTIHLVDDVIYWFLLKYHSQGYLLIISKLNELGNIMESFTVVNSPSQRLEDMLFFVPEYYLVEEDGSLLVFAETIYYENLYGISEDSKTDITLFKFDTFHNVEWTTSFDFLNWIDQASSLFKFNNTIYISFNSDNQYMWVVSISQNGLILQSSWISSSKQVETYGVGRFKFLLISPYYSFATDLYN